MANRNKLHIMADGWQANKDCKMPEDNPYYFTDDRLAWHLGFLLANDHECNEATFLAMLEASR